MVQTNAIRVPEQRPINCRVSRSRYSTRAFCSSDSLWAANFAIPISTRRFSSFVRYLSSLRMRPVIRRHQVRQRHLRVLLRGGKTGVAEQLLNRAEVGAIGQQVGRIGVAKTVRVNRGIAQNQKGVQLDDAARAPVSKPPVAVVEKDRLIGWVSGLPLREVAIESHSGFGAVRNLPLLAAFAAHTNPAFAKVEIRQVEPDQFTNSQAATVKHLENRHIA